MRSRMFLSSLHQEQLQTGMMLPLSSTNDRRNDKYATLALVVPVSLRQLPSECIEATKCQLFTVCSLRHAPNIGDSSKAFHFYCWKIHFALFLY